MCAAEENDPAPRSQFVRAYDAMAANARRDVVANTLPAVASYLALRGADARQAMLDDMGNILTDKMAELDRMRQRQNQPPARRPAQPRQPQAPPAQHRPGLRIDPAISVLTSQIKRGKLDINALEHALVQAGHLLENDIRRKETAIQIRRMGDGVSGAEETSVRIPAAPSGMGYASEGDGTGSFEGESEFSGGDDMGGHKTRLGLPPPPDDAEMAGAADCGCPTALN